MLTMLQLHPQVQYYLYSYPVDIRKGLHGLYGLIYGSQSAGVVSGSVYIFLNRRRTQIKLFTWEGDGFALYHKRLEKGSFEQPVIRNENTVKLSMHQLQCILQGVVMGSVKMRHRYQQKVA
jgi:transposase